MANFHEVNGLMEKDSSRPPDSPLWCEMTNLLVKDDRVEEEVNLALSAFILAVSLFFVSENWVAMTTRHKFIMKNDPT